MVQMTTHQNNLLHRHRNLISPILRRPRLQPPLSYRRQNPLLRPAPDTSHRHMRSELPTLLREPQLHHRTLQPARQTRHPAQITVQPRPQHPRRTLTRKTPIRTQRQPQPRRVSRNLIHLITQIPHIIPMHIPQKLQREVHILRRSPPHRIISHRTSRRPTTLPATIRHRTHRPRHPIQNPHRTFRQLHSHKQPPPIQSFLRRLFLTHTSRQQHRLNLTSNGSSRTRRRTFDPVLGRRHSVIIANQPSK